MYPTVYITLPICWEADDTTVDICLDDSNSTENHLCGLDFHHRVIDYSKKYLKAE